MAVGSRAPSLVDSNTHSRLSERRRRPHVSRGSPRRVAAAPQSCPNMGMVLESRGGSVLFMCECAMSPIFLSTSPGRTTTKDRCFCAPVARCSPVRISITASPRENRRAVNHIDSSRSPNGLRGTRKLLKCSLRHHGLFQRGCRHDRAIAPERVN